MYFKKSKFFLLSIFLIFFLSALFLCFFIYQNALEKNLNQTAFETLEELITQQKLNFNERVDADMKSIKNLANFVCYSPDNRDVMVSLGASLVQNTNFDYLLLSDQNGHAISSNGLNLDLQSRSYFQAALKGETILSQPSFSSVNNSLVISLATPIYRGEQVVGVLAAAYKLSDLSDLILPSYGGRAFAFITDREGSVIYSPNNQTLVSYQQNLFDSISKAEFIQYDTRDDMIKKTHEQRGGKSLFSVQNHKLLIQYAPLDINGWYIVMVAPESVISTQADSIAKDSTTLTGSVLALFSLLTIYTLYLQKKHSDEKLASLSELETVAYYDSLTTLPNLPKFKRDAKEILLAHPDRRYVILKFDIHNFKIINELYGFEMGNTVICAMANFISKMAKDRNLIGTLARVTADEFLILAETDDALFLQSDTLIAFDDKLHEALTHIIGAHRIECRYGRYLLDLGENDITNIVEKVNLAHRVAKDEQTKYACDYHHSFKDRALREADIENRMESALATEEFTVFLQPKYDLQTELVVGAEALVRWRESTGALLPPSEFIPLFERNGFILTLDMYVFEHVCQLLSRCMQEHRTLLPISVNFSKLHLTNLNFVKNLSKLADKYQVPKKWIEIELTESILFNNEEAFGIILHQLHSEGFTLSMDDFGTGYSSLGLLKNLPVDVLKIDKVFFSDTIYKDRGKLVLESVMQMARKLNICTVAEGVERKDDIDFLRAVGCDIVQGYYFSMPISSEEYLKKFAP